MESMTLLSHTQPAKKFSRFYLEKLSRVQSLLSSSTTIILAQAIIFSDLQEPPPWGHLYLLGCDPTLSL